MLEQLQNERLIFVTGKGGVGKSTCTAAVAEALVREGRRVLIIETDTYSAMGELLGGPLTEGEESEIRDNLWAVNLQSSECLVRTLTRYVPSERAVRAITSNRVTRAFFDSAPSVNEFVLLDQVQDYAETSADRFDHVVVDLPASGHAVSFLSVPRTLQNMMRGVGPIAKRAATIAETIEDDRKSAVVAVCLPEEMPVNETIELAENLEETLGRGLTLAIANMVHRSPIKSEHREAFEALAERVDAGRDPVEVLSSDDRKGLDRVVAGNALALDWYDRDRRYLDILHETLEAPVIEIPMFYEIADRNIVSGVVNHLSGGGPDPDSEPLAS